MANLAATDTPVGERRRPTFNRDAIIPRRNTQAPDLEVNARVSTPDSGADELRRLFGGADATIDAGVDYLDARQARQNQADAGRARVAAETGQPQDPNASRVYREAYSTESARSMAAALDQRVTGLVQDRLANEDDPATPQDIAGIIDDNFKAAALDPQGRPLDFGSPQASALIARGMAETRQRLLGGALDVIRTRTNTRLANTVAANVVNEMLGQDPTTASTVTEVPVPPSNSAPDAPGQPAPAQGQSDRGSRTTPLNEGNQPARFQVQGWTVGDGFGAQRRGHVHKGVDMFASAGTSFPVGQPFHVVESHRQTSGTGDGGNMAQVRFNDGSIWFAMHLPNLPASGDYAAGSDVLRAGNTGNARGTDAHIHWQPVNALAHSIYDQGRHAVAAYLTGNGAQVAGSSRRDVNVNAGEAFTGTIQAPTAAEQTHAPIIPVDFEAAMRRIPSNVDRGTAKTALMQGFINAAEERGDPTLLDNLWHSQRADGTPSFTQDEVAHIREARDAIRNRVRTDAERARNDRFEANEGQVLSQFVAGHDPSITSIRQLAQTGAIRPTFAYTLIRSVESEQEQNARQDRADARDADRDHEAQLDYAAAAEVESYRSGAISQTTPAELQRRFQAGEFGAGRRGAARYLMITSAYRQGGQLALQQPEAAQYAAQLHSNFAPHTDNGGRLIIGMDNTNRMSAPQYAAAQARYRTLVSQGTAPAQAYEQAVREYRPQPRQGHQGPGLPPNLAQRLQQLQSRASTP